MLEAFIKNILHIKGDTAERTQTPPPTFTKSHIRELKKNGNQKE
jgi:hypothetical protein